MGKMGYDIVVDKLHADELAFSQEALRNYRNVDEIIWHGDLYRLSDPWENPFAALMYVDERKERAVFFGYLVTNRFDFTFTPNPVKLNGLDPAKKYRLKELNVFPGTSAVIDESAVYSGDFLMKAGFNPDVNLMHSSVVVEIKEVKQ